MQKPSAFQPTEFPNRPPVSPSDSFYSIAAFICFFPWFSALLHNFDVSPLKLIITQTGTSSAVFIKILFIAFAAGSFLTNLYTTDQYSPRLLLLLQGIWVSVSAFLPFIDKTPVLFVLAGICGLVSGALFFKIVYSLIFFTPKGSWARYIALIYLFVQIVLYGYLIFPVKQLPLPAYAFSLIFQALCIFFTLRIQGSVIQVRRMIPEAELSWSSLALPLIAIIGIYTLVTAVKNIVTPTFPNPPWLNYYQIVPNMLTLAFLYFWGYRMKRIRFLQLFLIMTGLSFATFQLFKGSAGGGLLFETLMQPAYLFLDVFIYSYIGDMTYKYGKKLIRARLLFLSLLVVIGLTEALGAWLVEISYIAQPSLFFLLYLLVFGLLAVLPSLENILHRELDDEPLTQGNNNHFHFSTLSGKYLSSAVTIDSFEINHGDNSHDPNSYLKEVKCSTGESDPPSNLFGKLLNSIPLNNQLTQRETEVLALICEKQDNDIIADTLGISKNTLKIHIRNIYEKLNVASRNELFAKINPIPNDSPVLTQRENEVLDLIIAEKELEEIAAALYISIKTVKVHLWNIYRKFAVENRAELVKKINKIH